MLTISKPLSASQAQTYHAKEFTSAEQNYWKQNDRTLGEWHGKLAEKFGLIGGEARKNTSHVSRTANTLIPPSSLCYRVVQEYEGADGKAVAPVEHRAGWDATFSAPKSISLTALVGGDDRVRDAHREAVNVALNELERYTQARIGGNNPAETTGSSSPPSLSMTPPVPWTATPRRSSTRTLSSSTSPSAMTGKRGPYRSADCSSRSSLRRRYTNLNLTYRLRGLGYEN